MWCILGFTDSTMRTRQKPLTRPGRASRKIGGYPPPPSPKLALSLLETARKLCDKLSVAEVRRVGHASLRMGWSLATE